MFSEIEAPLQEPSLPDFTQLLQPQTVRDGERIQFKVRFTGFPRPKITWFHNGTIIKSTTDIKIVIDYERGESMLIIVEIFPEDEGEYTCSASNEYGETITTCKLTVICKYKLFILLVFFPCETILNSSLKYFQLNSNTNS